MQDQAHLIGAGAAARSAVAFELRLVQLAQVLGLTTGEIQPVIDPLCAAVLEQSEDEADIEHERVGLDARHDPACGLPPALRGVAGLGIAAQFD
jgi:hypothetical protein